ncbi:hypothetical protein [Promicromonospora sp. NPDC023805]|uniref:hypothetical protein n=1 Tax=Promicromonospora sp. NPDC023805 TaxID=3154696 RepID=UPI0033DF35BC
MRSSRNTTRATCGPLPSTATGLPLSSCPWQYGQTAATVPNSGSRPWIAGSVSHIPVVSTTARVANRAAPSTSAVSSTRKPAPSGTTADAAVSRTVTVA